MPTEEAGTSQTRRKRRWVGAAAASKPGQKKGRKLFTPGDREWQPLGMDSTIAKKAITKREAARIEAEWLARHFQLEGTSLGSESSTTMSSARREAYRARLTAFPRMPEHELQELERIIGAYGLPVARLSSDTAAFVLRRIMMEYFKLNTLRRVNSPGLFTKDELLELLHRRGWTTSDLAAITRAEDPRAGLTNIARWLNEASTPVGIHAMRVNRLIDQHVRRADKRRPGGNLGQRLKSPSENPETVKRTARARKSRTLSRDQVPTASAAVEAGEGNDA